MHSLHPQARTTPAVRQEIARSREPTGVLAQRLSVSTETVRKWRKRGAHDCQDHSSRPHKLPWKATEEERAIVCALRRSTGFPLDDLTFVVTHFLPHLNRDAVYRILKAEGLGRLPPAQQRKRRSGTFKEYDLGFIHIDIKHLPKLRTTNGERRKRYLYVAIDRCSRWVHLAVKDDELTTSAVAFLNEAVRAFPFKVTHVLTDHGSCFTADGFEDACRRLKLEHRTTKPYTPQTNGLVERFNGRVQREVLGITIYSHRDLETLLKGFNQAYNRRRQRVLKGASPEQVVQRRLAAEPKLANRRYKPPDSDALPPALQVVAHAKEVSHPDTFAPVQPVWPGFGQAEFKATAAGADIPNYVKKGEEYTYAKHGFVATSYALPTDQYGTQLDPPAHWDEYGATISDLPPTYAIRPLVVIPIHEKVAANPGYHLSLQDVNDWESRNGRIPEGAVVMVRSDWYKGWNDPARFATKPHPGVSLDALKFLHLERKILFHGHEPLDTDTTPTLEGESWLLHNHFTQAEGVANLDKVPETGALISIGFAKPLGGTGGYARYVAIAPADWPHGVTVAEAPGAPLPKQTGPLRRDEKGVLRPQSGSK